MRAASNRTRAAIAATVAVTLSACTWETDVPEDATSIAVDPARELVITDDSDAVTSLSHNGDAGPLSFRRAMDRLGLEGEGTRRWLEAWSRRLREEGRGERADELDQTVLCSWMRRAPANECDDRCVRCRAHALPGDDAPFRLIAVVNRTDLSVMPDRAADGGEARLVFAVTDGAGDDASAAALPMAVIFEYAQPGAALDWSKRWHALGAESGDGFSDALSSLAGGLVDAGTIAQVRTADAHTGAMLLHQFELRGGALVATDARNSPDWSRVSESAIRDYARDHGDAIEEGTAVMPREWWATSSSLAPAPPWLDGVPHHEPLVRQTCGGCHAQSSTAFQIDPRAKGAGRLSTFLSNPSGADDELRRRVRWMQLTLWNAE